ncbi:sensor histidine kinase [Nonomuraea cavernae]|uniref:sensor histidine kinase n=1 Tax=Nonomuraea cavernae TaxID=2045107 RepID=UPI00340ECDD7
MDHARGWSARSPAPPWALTVLAALLIVIALSYAELPPWAWAGALLAPIAAVALLGTYPVISLGVCATTSIATALGMRDAVPVWSAAVGGAIFVISLLAGRRMSRSAPALGVFAVGATLHVPLGLITGDVWSVGLLLVLTVVLPWVLGRSIRQQTEAAAMATERARLQERNRIARDMHDTLGHELSLLALRAGALEMAPELDERHRATAAQLRAGAGLATERLAEILTLMRDGEPAPLHPVAEDRIDDLVDRAVQSGLAASLEWHGVRRLPPVIGRAAHRVVQEALTNAAKHAAGAAVRVRLATEDDTTVVTITNGLPSNARRGTGGRTGLAGLREQVRLAGGTLRAGPRDHEYEIVATLPHMGAS